MFQPSRVLLAALLLVASASAETILVEDAQLSLVVDVRVSCPDAGRVESMLVQPGDHVERNAILLELDRDLPQTAVRNAETQLEIAVTKSKNDVNIRYAKKKAEVAENDLKRAQRAVARFERAVSAGELERQGLLLEEAVLGGEQAEHQQTIDRLTTRLRQVELEQARIQLQHRTVRSPVPGIVAEMLVQAGEWVERGTPVARIVNLDKLRIVALIPATHLEEVMLGQPATFRVRGSESGT